MEVGSESLVPGVQCGDEAQLSPESVFTEGQQRPGCSPKQNREHHLFMTQDDGVELVGQGKDHVEVFYGEDLRSSFLKPAFPRHVLTCGAMPVAAGMVQNADGTAMVTPIDMASKIRGAAV